MPLVEKEMLEHRYRVDKRIGEGGFGAVYRAWDTRLDTPCAIKESFDTSDEATRQFAHEASILANLRNPHLPRVTDYFDLHGKGLYLVMDFIEGEDLWTKVVNHGKGLPEEEVINWIKQVCEALAYLHGHHPPVIHRDIKPQNIIVTGENNAVLVDFGLSKIYETEKSTTMGARGLTPGFSPPEQYGQGTTDQRSDIYALGATIYALITAHVPYESIDRMTRNHLLENPRKFQPGITRELVQAIAKALKINPDSRYQSIQEFHAEMEVCSDSAGFQQYPPRLPVKEKSPTEEARVSGDELQIEVTAGVQMTFVRVPAGVFLMGSTEDDELASEDEKPSGWISVPGPPEYTKYDELTDKEDKPQHKVYLDEYWIGKTPVTNVQYRVFEEAPGYEGPEHWEEDIIPKGKKEHPVVYVSWHDAVAFCDWLSYVSSKSISLPSEAEWEKAARGTDGRTYPWGEQKPDIELCNFDDQVGDTTRVGRYSPQGDSPYGCVDMAGNVDEWTRSMYTKRYGDPIYGYPYEAGDGREDPDAEGIRVQRGGSFYGNEFSLHATSRSWDVPEVRYDGIGFRCVLSRNDSGSLASAVLIF